MIVNNNLFVLSIMLEACIYFRDQFRYKHRFIVISENKNKQIKFIVLKEVYVFMLWQKKGKIKYLVTFLIKFL